MLLGIFIGAAIGSSNGDAGRVSTTATNRPAASTPATTRPPVATQPPAPAAAVPTVRDFKLAVKVLSKQCFGSAGCNITYRIDASWTKTFDPDIEYELVYEVRGGEDGPQINTITVQGDSYERTQEESISTSSSGAKLRAVVTSVEET
jgi:hypothetical protein